MKCRKTIICKIVIALPNRASVYVLQEERMRAVVVAAGGSASEHCGGSGGGSGLFPDGAADAIKEDNDGDIEDGGGDDD